MQKLETLLGQFQQSQEMIDFLFKCLDRFGQEASVLFKSVDFNSASSEVIRRLFTDYSDKFDFHFINTNLLKNFYEIENRIIEGQESMKNEQIEMAAEIKRYQEEMSRQKDEQHERKIQEIQSSFSEEIERMKHEHEVEIQKQKDEFEEKISNLLEIVRNLSEKVEQHDNSIGKMIDKSKEKNNPISCPFLGISNLEGIISCLKDEVKLSHGGKHHQEYPVTNIYNNDYNKYFYNYNYYSPSSENDSYIKFDFGQSKRIYLHSYLIRSNCGSPSTSFHAKSWRIEGSNDESDWKLLDHRENDETLNGPYKFNHFECQESHNRDKNNRYRFI